MRNAVAALAVGIVGLVTTMGSGVALVPRVRLVEVLTVVATAIGSGAALAIAVVQFRKAMTAARAGRNDATLHGDEASAGEQGSRRI